MGPWERANIKIRTASRDENGEAIACVCPSGDLRIGTRINGQERSVVLAGEQAERFAEWLLRNVPGQRTSVEERLAELERSLSAHAERIMALEAGKPMKVGDVPKPARLNRIEIIADADLGQENWQICRFYDDGTESTTDSGVPRWQTPPTGVSL
jgi:hypothetical protein